MIYIFSLAWLIIVIIHAIIRIKYQYIINIIKSIKLFKSYSKNYSKKNNLYLIPTICLIFEKQKEWSYTERYSKGFDENNWKAINIYFIIGKTAYIYKYKYMIIN